MLKRLLPLLALLLVLLDLFYTLVQHYHTPLDGDMANIIWPGQYYRRVLEDPFGMGVLLNQEIYSAPNRFFAHWFMSGYFKTVPLWLQTFFTPIDSVFASAALLKTGIQALLLVTLAYLSAYWFKGGFKTFLLALVLLFPLFQTAGYTSQLGFIDQAPTYAVFYGFSFGILLLFIAGFWQLRKFTSAAAKSFLSLFLVVLAVILAFSGPLIPPIALIALPLLTLFALNQKSPYSTLKNSFQQNPLISLFRLPKLPFFIGFAFFVLCLYSIYLGFYNAENPVNAISIPERYARLPLGFYYLLVRKLGLPLLFIIIGVNVWLLRKNQEPQAGKLIMLLQWIGVFALFYLLLLPLGGYREYRPNIIRKDTFMPVLLPLVFFYCVSTIYLLKNLFGKPRRFYLAGVAALLVLYTISDKPTTGKNACERDGLEKIAQSPEEIVKLDNDCTILEWQKVTDPKTIEAHARLLQFWGITKKKTYYVQE